MCNCQSECKTNRCDCLKEGKACNDKCKCSHCKNPFNSIENAEQLSDCARAHIKKVILLSEKELNETYELPCGCKEVTLEKLLECYECSKCEQYHYYSFCMSAVVDMESMWHCFPCGTCSDDGQWHCKHCNKCTYGLTLECEHCGKESPYLE